MATINGARALGLEALVGSITPGKRADIILVRTTDLNVLPAGDVRSMLVHAANPANVDTVLVDGRVLKRGGALVMHDIAEVAGNAAQSASAVRRRAGLPAF
jgi:cytosine/adenosine deaminase-related metal-dependent hydrolase